MFSYICFYKGRSIVVQALRSFDAQTIAAKKFKARRAWEVEVKLAARSDGSEVVHSAATI
jgi:hypothetical protein